MYSKVARRADCGRAHELQVMGSRPTTGTLLRSGTLVHVTPRCRRPSSVSPYTHVIQTGPSSNDRPTSAAASNTATKGTRRKGHLLTDSDFGARNRTQTNFRVRFLATKSEHLKNTTSERKSEPPRHPEAPPSGFGFHGLHVGFDQIQRGHDAHRLALFQSHDAVYLGVDHGAGDLK